jgi:carbamoyltransferase
MFNGVRYLIQSQHDCSTIKKITGDMFTLGINAAFHDSAAALIKDGVLIAAAEDERFTHIKHGKRPIPFTAYELPYHAIDYCLQEAGITMNDIDHIAYSFDPALLSAGNINDTQAVFTEQLNELFLSYIQQAPQQLRDGICKSDWPVGKCKKTNGIL